MMKKLLCLLLALCFMFALCACGNETTTDDPSEKQTTEATTTEATDTQQAPDDETIDDGKVAYTVKVLDEGGNPVEAVDMVQVCDETNTCSIFMLKNGEGTMRLAEAEYHATLMKGLPEGYEYATEETEFSFDDTHTCVITLKAVE